jgi:hypothetical protein
MYNINILAQVVIQDEIVLYETENPDEETLTMPFYGRAHGSVNSGAIVNGYLRKVVIEAGGQIEVRECPCVSFCQSISHGWTINNLPASTPVNVTVYSHCVNGQFVEAATELIDLGNNEYEIKAFNPNYGQWFLATTLEFSATSPPACFSCSESRDESCEECIDPTNLLPEINLVQVPTGTDGLDPCAEDDSTLGALKISNNGLLNYNFVLNACYNTQLQRWWFSIEGNELNFKYVLDYCYQNITNLGATLINSYENFPQGYGCNSILKDINTFYTYGAIPQGGYILKSMIEAHELRHLLDLTLLTQIQKEVLFLELLDEAPLCEEFSSVEEATQYWRVNRFGKLIIDYWDSVFADHKNNSSKPGYEELTHKRVYPEFDQIKINALCYWNCSNLLPPNTNCP